MPPEKKPRERKPLIAPGSVLTPSAPEGGGDVMSRIIARDRERRGVAEEEPVDELASQQISKLTDKLDNQLVNQQVNKLASQQESVAGGPDDVDEPPAARPEPPAVPPLANQLISKQTNKLTSKQNNKLVNQQNAPSGDPIRDAIFLRLAMPYGDLTQEAAVLVAARVPRELSDRFDLVAQVQKRNKQDVLADALRLYIAQVVAGKE